MSKSVGKGNKTGNGHKYAARTAYTLNNHQPVRCTIIGDQPLFFMDYEEALLEEVDTIEVFERLDALEDRIGVLQEKVKADNHREVLEVSEKAAELLEAFADDAAFATAASRAADSGASADSVLATISKSRLGASLVEVARKHGTGFVMGGAVSTALYDRRQNTVFINPTLNETDQVLLLARELRRIWQHRNGALLHPLTFHPDQAILINRAQIADLAVMQVRMAWELQLSGIREPWDRLESSSYADLVRAFAREAYLDFRTINSGEACSAAFEAWFLSERCRTEDRRLIQQMLADYQGYVFENIDPSRQISAELVLALGSQPFGKNYLAPYIQTILADPLFTEVRDRSNANFLWFIKFERSFRETEQELQTTADARKGPGGETSVGKENIKKHRLGKHEKAADIVSLPRGRSHSGNFSGKKTFGSGKDADTGGDNVIVFRAAPKSAG